MLLHDGLMKSNRALECDGEMNEYRVSDEAIDVDRVRD